MKPLQRSTHHSQDVQEQVDEIKVERERAQDVLVGRQSLHDRVRIIDSCTKRSGLQTKAGARVLTVAREEQHTETGDDQIRRMVEGQEDLHETRDQHAHQPCKQVGAKVGKVILQKRVSTRLQRMSLRLTLD